MKPSADPLVLKCNPGLGDPHPKSSQWQAVDIRLLEKSDIEGKVVYAGPRQSRLVESFVLRAAA